MQPEDNCMQTGTTINSFSQRPSCAQATSYVTILAQISVFYACLQPSLPEASRIAWSIVYGLLALALIISTAITSMIDPSDPVVRKYKSSLFQRNSLSRSDYCYCTYCDSYCNSNSKHCKSCNRCVDRFDHHCIWINNCIGGRNYKQFMVMIVSAMSMMLIFEAAGIHYTVNVVNEYNNNISVRSAREPLVWTLMAVSLIFSCLLIYLVGLHIYLISKGMTTFEYSRGIHLQEERKKRKQNMQARQKAAQEMELQRANTASPEIFQISNGRLEPANNQQREVGSMNAMVEVVARQGVETAEEASSGVH